MKSFSGFELDFCFIISIFPDSFIFFLLFLEGKGVAVTNVPALDLLGLSSIFSKHSLREPS